jgi:gamma-glutamylcyclotransferase (GGCT)/AIG2-like uncharacterized protein YtfP
VSTKITPKKFDKKKLKYGTMSTAFTAIFIAVIVLLNVIVGVIAKKKPMKVDLTISKIYQMSDTTLEYLKNLTQDVDILITADEMDFKGDISMKLPVAEMVERYASHSDRINVLYVDINKNPDIIAKYQDDYDGTIYQNSVVIASEGKVRSTSYETFFSAQYDMFGQLEGYTGFRAEQVLTSAIMYVTDADPKKVTLVTNGDWASEAIQTSALALISLLGFNGYELRVADLDKEDMEKDTDLAILFAPYNDLTPAALNKLKAFLDNDGKLGKNMLYVADMFQRKTPNLDAFLEEWGLVVQRSLVEESDEGKKQVVRLAGSQNYATALRVDVADEEFSDILTTPLPIVSAYSRPVNILWTGMSGRYTQPLLITSDTSYLYPYDELLPNLVPEASNTETDTRLETTETNAETSSETVAQTNAETNAQTNAETNAQTAGQTDAFDPKTAEKKAYYVGAVGYRYLVSDPGQSALIVLGTNSFTDDNIMTSSVYNNSSFLIGVLNKLTGKGGIAITETVYSDTTLLLDEKTQENIGFVVIFVIPCVVLGIGLFVYLKRRNK